MLSTKLITSLVEWLFEEATGGTKAYPIYGAPHRFWQDSPGGLIGQPLHNAHQQFQVFRLQAVGASLRWKHWMPWERIANLICTRHVVLQGVIQGFIQGVRIANLICARHIVVEGVN